MRMSVELCGVSYPQCRFTLAVDAGDAAAGGVLFQVLYFHKNATNMKETAFENKTLVLMLAILEFGVDLKCSTVSNNCIH